LSAGLRKGERGSTVSRMYGVLEAVAKMEKTGHGITPQELTGVVPYNAGSTRSYISWLRKVKLIEKVNTLYVTTALGRDVLSGKLELRTSEGSKGTMCIRLPKHKYVDKLNLVQKTGIARIRVDDPLPDSMVNEETSFIRPLTPWEKQTGGRYRRRVI